MKFFLILLPLIYSTSVFCQPEWEEVMIPMSDDSVLAADVYFPEGWTQGPAILIQTPYNKNLYHFAGLPLGIGYNQDEMNFAFVIADWRGFWGSSGAAYAGSPTRGEDGFSIVQWMAAQSWCDGNVGTWGPSALGKIQYMTARENPPNLRCIVPLVAGPQTRYEEYYPGGSLRTEYVEQLDALGFGIGSLVLSQPYDNLAWEISENATYYPAEISVPTLMIGGWYDHNVDLMIDFFAGLQQNSPASEDHRLLFGPWAHGGSGTASVGDSAQGELFYPQAEGWSDSLALAFLDFHLRGISNGWNVTPAVQFFQMGENEWMQSTSWPPVEVNNISLYMHSDHSLQLNTSTDENVILSFEYDPENPSPTVGGPTLHPDLEQGPFEQSEEVESRDDIHVFSSDPLAAPVAIQGKVTVELHISSDAVDTDFAIRLCDVYPDQSSMLVCDGIYRMRFLEGFTATDETFLEEGGIYSCTIELPHTAITFEAGHRLRVDVSSSNYPRFNRNMNNGEEMYPLGNGDTLINPVVAINNIHVSLSYPSHVNLPVVGGFPDGMTETLTSTFNIYPVPSADKIFFEEPFESPVTYLEIIDSHGKIVLRHVGKKCTPVDVSSLPDGIYHLKAGNAGNVAVQRFIIQRR